MGNGSPFYRPKLWWELSIMHTEDKETRKTIESIVHSFSPTIVLSKSTACRLHRGRQILAWISGPSKMDDTILTSISRSARSSSITQKVSKLEMTNDWGHFQPKKMPYCQLICWEMVCFRRQGNALNHEHWCQAGGARIHGVHQVVKRTRLKQMSIQMNSWFPILWFDFKSKFSRFVKLSDLVLIP